MNDLSGPPIGRAKGFDPHARQFVDAKRAAGISWSNIAKMLGRSEVDVRATFDPALNPKLAASASGQGVRVADILIWRPTTQAQRVLVQLEAVSLRRRDVAAGLGVSPEDTGQLLARMLVEGRVEQNAGHWSLTPAGHSELRKLRGKA